MKITSKNVAVTYLQFIHSKNISSILCLISKKKIFEYTFFSFIAIFIIKKLSANATAAIRAGLKIGLLGREMGTIFKTDSAIYQIKPHVPCLLKISRNYSLENCFMKLFLRKHNYEDIPPSPVRLTVQFGRHMGKIKLLLWELPAGYHLDLV